MSLAVTEPKSFSWSAVLRAIVTATPAKLAIRASAFFFSFSARLAIRLRSCSMAFAEMLVASMAKPFGIR